jgi:hypothetical protein
MPSVLMNFVIAFAGLFSEPVFKRVKVLVMGAILLARSAHRDECAALDGSKAARRIFKPITGCFRVLFGVLRRVREYC